MNEKLFSHYFLVILEIDIDEKGIYVLLTTLTMTIDTKSEEH